MTTTDRVIIDGRAIISWYGLPEESRKEVSRALNGLSRAMKGVSRAIVAVSHAINGISRGMNGLSCVMNWLSRLMEGVERGVNGVSPGVFQAVVRNESSQPTATLRSRQVRLMTMRNPAGLKPQFLRLVSTRRPWSPPTGSGVDHLAATRRAPWDPSLLAAWSSSACNSESPHAR